MAKYNISVLVDNDSPYVFTDVGLDPYILSLAVSCGGKYAQTWQRDGSATLLLDNSGGEFSPYNASSPFYDKLLSKRQVRITLNGVIFWTGLIEKLVPSLDMKSPIATLTMTQGVQNLKEIFLSGNVYQSKNGNELIGALMVDNTYTPIGHNPVFVLDFSLLGDDITFDPVALVNNELFTDIVYAYSNSEWTLDTSLYAAIEEVLQAEQAIAFMGRTGKLSMLPFWYVNTSLLAGTEDIDNKSINATFTSSPEIVNKAVVDYFPREVLLNEIVKVDTRSVTAGETFEISSTTLDTEQKRSILANVVVTQGGNKVAISEWDAKRVVLVGIVDGTDVTIEVRADILSISDKLSLTVSNDSSIVKYRHIYKKNFSYKLISSINVANTVGNRALTRRAFPFVYIEAIGYVDYFPYTIGDVILANSALLPDGGSRHLIVGEEHLLTKDTMETTYYMLGSDSAAIFVLDESLLDSINTIL